MEDKYSVIVDSERTLEEMIIAGNYESSIKINPEFCKIITKIKCTITIELLRIEEHLSFTGVVSNLKQKGYRPTYIEELLSLGAQYPDLQKTKHIHALGTYWYHRTIPEYHVSDFIWWPAKPVYYTAQLLSYGDDRKRWFFAHSKDETYSKEAFFAAVKLD